MVIATYLIVSLFLAYVASEWVEDMYTMREHGYMNPYKNIYHGFFTEPLMDVPYTASQLAYVRQLKKEERELRAHSRTWEKRSLDRRSAWDRIENLAMEGRLQLATVEALGLVRGEPQWLPGWLVLGVLAGQRGHHETKAVCDMAIRELMAA